jgi:hypothetical protein
MSTSTAARKPIPVVRGLPVVGNLAELARDPAAFFVRGYLEHGPVFRARALNRTLTVLAGPELARSVSPRDVPRLYRTGLGARGEVPEA